jgi:hypothetical protein
MELEISGCDDIEQEVSRLIALESSSLSALEVNVRANVDCSVHQIVLRVDTDGASSTFERVLMVVEGIGRARLVALALMELVAASTTELPMSRRVGESVTLPSEHAEPEQPSRSRDSVVGIRVNLSADVSSSPLLPRGGGEVGVEVVITDWLHWTLDVRGLYGRTETSLTMLEISDFSAATSFALLVPIGDVALGASVGGRFGALFIAATPHNRSTYAGGEREELYGGPMGRAIVDWRVAPEATLHVELEVGGTLRPVVATVSPANDELFRFDGAWGALAIGATLWP